MPPSPLDEALTSEQAQKRVDALRDHARQLAALRDESYAASREAKRAIGELEVALARAGAADRGTPEGLWRPGRTILPIAKREPVPPARVAELGELARQLKESASVHDARARQLMSRIVELTGEANILEARQAERFRTGLLLSPTGSILPPRMVERRVNRARSG